jgi:hypothetical protein
MLRTCPLLAGLIASLVIGNAWGESKRYPSHSQQPIQAPSAQPAQPPAPDERGTDKIPFSVKIVPGERTKEQAEKEERERREHDEKAAIDERLTDQTRRLADETENLVAYTRWLAAFTLLLFLAAVGQIGLFVWQLKLIRESLNEAKVAADAAKFGARAARESAGIARASSEAAIAFERPYVRISEIKAIIRSTRGGEDVFQNTEILREPYAVCIIENYGKTPAFVEKTEAQLRFSAGDLQIILEKGKPIPVVTLKTGQSYHFEVPLGEPINQQRAEDIQSGGQYFWLHFNFIYRDVLGKIHQTPDIWRYTFDLDSFSGGTAYREAT